MVTALSFSSCSKFEIYEAKRRGLAQWCFPSIRGIWSIRLVATKTHRTRRGLTRWGRPSLFQITIKLETKTEQMGERLTESRRNRWKGNPNGGSPRQGAQKSFTINTSPFTIFVINFRQIINNIRQITNHVQQNSPSFCHLCLFVFWRSPGNTSLIDSHLLIPSFLPLGNPEVSINQK